MLEKLVWECCVGTPRVEEIQPDGRVNDVRVNSIAATTLLTFHLDTEEGRQALGLSTSSKACDAMFLGVKRAPKTEARVAVLLVELKEGSHFDRAFAQLETCFNALRTQLENLLTPLQLGRARYALAVRTKLAAPANLKDIQRRQRKAKVRVLASADATQLMSDLLS
jgi:hypothetical protein